MRKLSITVLAFLALGSAAYAQEGGAYHPLRAAPNAPGAQTESGGATAGSNLSGYNALVASSYAPHPAMPGWGPGESWGRFPGSLNANGG
jgi:hypothetical protein